MRRLRELEAEGAVLYWGAWATVPVEFVRKDVDHVPGHWRTFGTRSSPLTHSPRLAANPANALLNYLYGILETESRLACYAMGLDPSIGLLHADLEYRDSFLFDLMEAARPHVDRFLLETLRTHVFRRDDFVETRQGACRLMPHAAKRVADTAPRWGQVVAPTAERVARMLVAPTTSSHKPIPTRLTQANRSAGRRSLKPHIRNPITQPNLMPRACRSCGVVLEGSSRSLYCETCFTERRAELNDRLSTAGPRELERLRREGHDPAHGGEAARVRGLRNSNHMKNVQAWELDHGSARDPSEFRASILPRLAGIPLSAIQRATGLSLGYCSFVRQGEIYSASSALGEAEGACARKELTIRRDPWSERCRPESPDFRETLRGCIPGGIFRRTPRNPSHLRILITRRRNLPSRTGFRRILQTGTSGCRSFAGMRLHVDGVPRCAAPIADRLVRKFQCIFSHKR